MLKRILSSSVIIAILVGLVYLDLVHPLAGVTGLWLLPLFFLLSLLAAGEMIALLEEGGQATCRWAVLLGVLLIDLLVSVPILAELAGMIYPEDCPVGRAGLPAVGMAASVMLLFFAEMFRYNPQRPVVPRVMAGTLAVAYVGLLGSFLVLIRGLGSPEQGMAALLSVVLVTKMSDSGAYFVGTLIGRHKLAPKLSPGKTIEGLLGGILFGCLASVFFFGAVGGRWNCRPTMTVCVLYGLVLTLVGVVGDLAESLLKRHADRKDSSRWLPGLGGVLDILDSLLLTFVVGYLFWVSGLMGS